MPKIQLALLWLCLALPVQAIIKTPLYLYVDDSISEQRLKFKGKDSYKATLSLEKGTYKIRIADDNQSCDWSLGAENEQAKLRFGTELPLSQCSQTNFFLKVVLAGDYEFTLLQNAQGFSLQAERKKQETATTFQRKLPPIECARWDGQAISVDVSTSFSEGEWVRDAYSGQTAQVENGMVTLMPAKESGGLLLLEKANAEDQPFQWEAATVYFAVTDRFANGRTDNDEPFNRHKDDGDLNIGTFHGGDLAGVIGKLDYLQALGVDALWLTPLFEQIHGFIGGNGGAYPFYAYHGYWPKDFTRLDPNFGTEEELRTLVSEAHKRGIRILFDVVMNHTGYETLADAQDAGLNVLNARGKKSMPERWNDWKPTGNERWSDWSNYINWSNYEWHQLWGPQWVRSGLPGFRQPGSDLYTTNLSGLPDFITEDERAKKLPPFLARKEDTRAVELEDADIVDYLTSWLTYWVAEFGIDGFRADTAQHVEREHWAQLKQQASTALEQWRANNPDDPLDSKEPFWMVAEAFHHGVFRDDYYDHGFDAVINFSYQSDALRQAQCLSYAESTYSAYAEALDGGRNFEILSYISSHDTSMFFPSFSNIELQKGVGTSLGLLPGAIQIYYGDESARPQGDTGSDILAGTRSDMNWAMLPQGEYQALLSHWQKIMNFRSRHPAIGAGSHRQLQQTPYVFERHLDDDRVVVVYAGSNLQ